MARTAWRRVRQRTAPRCRIFSSGSSLVRCFVQSERALAAFPWASRVGGRFPSLRPSSVVRAPLCCVVFPGLPVERIGAVVEGVFRRAGLLVTALAAHRCASFGSRSCFGDLHGSLQHGGGYVSQYEARLNASRQLFMMALYIPGSAEARARVVASLPGATDQTINYPCKGADARSPRASDNVV